MLSVLQNLEGKLFHIQPSVQVYIFGEYHSNVDHAKQQAVAIRQSKPRYVLHETFSQFPDELETVFSCHQDQSHVSALRTKAQIIKDACNDTGAGLLRCDYFGLGFPDLTREKNMAKVVSTYLKKSGGNPLILIVGLYHVREAEEAPPIIKGSNYTFVNESERRSGILNELDRRRVLYQVIRQGTTRYYLR